MQITREFLQGHISTMQNQIAAYTGAIQFAEMLLEKLAEPADSMTIDQFTDMVQDAIDGGSGGLRANQDAR